jgi:hypothetical protein
MKITLFRSDNCWAARYSGSGSERILEAFETDTLPTAFTDDAPAETVLAIMSALNPHDVVVLGPRIVYCACDEKNHGLQGCTNLPSPLNNTEHCQICHLGLCSEPLSKPQLSN